MSANGGGVAQVADDHGDDFNQVFSPDGKTIAFSSARDGDSDVYLIGTGGGAERKLTHNATEDVVQDWQPLRDTFPPQTHAFPAHAVRGKPLQLKYQVSENTGIAAIHIEGTSRNGEFGADYPPRTVVAGKTYRFTVPKFIVRHLPRSFRFCVLASDSSANLSESSCASVHIRRRHRKR
jgi:dipeptidyl aminopeptidase/acylaminoacyl peptidase